MPLGFAKLYLMFPYENRAPISHPRLEVVSCLFALRSGKSALEILRAIPPSLDHALELNFPNGLANGMTDYISL